MITPAFSPTATERVLPRLALDFTTGVLDSRVTVTRALNTATRVNSSGLIEIVNANLPRFDYDPVTLVPKGLLIEESRANLFTYSSDFADASWFKSAFTVASDNAISPDGTQNADTLTSTGNAALNKAVAATAGTSYTGSVYLRVASGSKTINIYRTDNGTGFAVSTVTVTTTWTRFTLTATASPTATTVTFQLGGGNSFLSGNAIEVYGMQLEAGAFASSYIPTTTTSLTRNRDTVAMTGTNFSDWYNATAGSIVFDGTASNTAAAYLFAFCGAGNTGNDALYAYVSTNYLVQAFNATVLQANINTGIAGGNSIKVGAGYASNNFGVAANGGNTATDNTYSQPTIDKLRIGAAPNANVAGIVYARKISYYPQRLTNAELQAFSK